MSSGTPDATSLRASSSPQRRPLRLAGMTLLPPLYPHPAQPERVT
jgi:hypothetical protein